MLSQQASQKCSISNSILPEMKISHNSLLQNCFAIKPVRKVASSANAYIKQALKRLKLVQQALVLPMQSQLPFPLEQINQLVKFNPHGVIHVGAHLAQEVPLYQFLGISRIVLFEPQPAFYNKLKMRYRKNPGIRVEPYGLGSSSKEQGMYLEKSTSPNMSASSSFLKPLKHIQDYPYVEFSDSISFPVQIRTLDSFSIEDCNFLVIDTQGFELEVLKGSAKTLKFIDCVICEYWLNEAYQGVPSINELIELLKFHGFTLKLQSYDRTFGNLLFAKQ